MTLNTQFEPHITCPYCGYVFTDSWEYDVDGEVECEACERTFFLTIDTTITYSTLKIDDTPSTEPG